MRRLALLLLLIVALPGCASSGDLTFCTWNVENLFDAYDDPYANDVDRRGGLQVKPQDELAAVGKVLSDIDADIVALQEVENRGVLEGLVDRYLPDKGYQVVLIEGNDRRGIDVAVLSKLPVDSATSYRHHVFTTSAGEKVSFSRDVLRVVVDLPDAGKASVYVVHLKSRSGGEEAARKRRAEAAELRRIVTENMKEGDLVFIAGDLNDDVASGTPAIIAGDKGPKGFWIVPARSAKGSDITWHGRFKSRWPPIRFDYIFVSPALKNAYVDGSGLVYTREPVVKASDHYPVIARFHLED